MRDLYSLLHETGLVQFGNFGGDPVRLNFTLLPSYPDVMRALIVQAAEQIDSIDHLVGTSDAIALATGISLHVGIPLVYSRGSNAAPVHDLVGAYDIGHPAILLDLVTTDTAQTLRLVNAAKRVGLDIEQCLCVIDLSARAEQLQMNALIDLPHMTRELAGYGYLPESHVDIVIAWIAAAKRRR